MIKYNARINRVISLFNMKRQRTQNRRFENWINKKKKTKKRKEKKIMISMIENIENEKWLDNMKSCINICFLKR